MLALSRAPIECDLYMRLHGSFVFELGNSKTHTIESTIVMVYVHDGRFADQNQANAGKETSDY